MKKKILAVVLTLSMVLSFIPFGVFAADTDTTVTFELGSNGSASHSDGSSKTSYSETVGDYTLNLTATQQFYTGARDATGNSAIKLGSGSKVGGFTFTVPDDVDKVIINVAGYKANTVTVLANDVSTAVTTTSNNGEYTAIEVDTTTTKAVSFTTSTNYRAMVNSISYVIPASEGGDTECEHSYTEEITTEATCTEDGVKTYTCSLCGDSYEEKIEALGHTNENGTCSVCGADLSSIVFELGADGTTAKENSSASTSYTETVNGYTLSITGASRMYLDCIDANGNGVIKFGASSSAGSCSFTVPDDVSKVIISVAGRNTATANILVNGVAQTISTTSNSGVYEDVEVDTSINKTVTFSTASGGYRAFVNSIAFVVSAESEEECEHSYTEEVTTAPTCTATGVKTYTCTLCGASYTEAVAATGHNMVAGEVVAPTVESQGYTIYTCSVCGTTENKDFTNPLAPAIPEGTEPVIFEFGENGDAAHSDGNSATATYEATNGDYTFSFADGVRVYPGAFDAKGNSALKLGTSSAVASFSFTVPDKVSQVWIRVAGYKDNNSSFTVNDTDYTISTYSDYGIYTYIVVDTTTEKTVSVSTRSANYGYRAMIDSITYLASTACEHIYESVTVDPTCTEAGKTVYTCTVCGESYEEVIAATGHAYGTVVTAPTCTEQGYTTYTCSVCGDTYVADYTDATGHAWGGWEITQEAEDTRPGVKTRTCGSCGVQETTSYYIGATPDFAWYGDGSADTFYIGTLEEFMAFLYISNGRCDLNGDGTTDAAYDFAGKTVKLTADINLGGIATTFVLGHYNGDFDGQEHTISNFYCRPTDFTKTSTTRLGLFRGFGSSNNSALLSNLTVSDVTIDVGTGDIGGAVGYCAAHVDNVHVANVVMTCTDSTAEMGGMFNYLAKQPQVTDCSITNVSIDAPNGAKLIGGLSPRFRDGNGYYPNGLEIDGLRINVDMGSVVDYDPTANNACLVGGVVAQTETGYNYPQFHNINIKNLEVTAKGAVLVGGLIAETGAENKFYDCSVQGTIDASGVTDADCYVGGLSGNAGWNHDVNQGGIQFVRCTADVDIISGGAAAGGLIGSCTNQKDNNKYIIFTDCVASGDVTSAGAAGGIAGIADRGVFDNCVATGKISGAEGSTGTFAGELHDLTPVYNSNYPEGTWPYAVDEISINYYQYTGESVRLPLIGNVEDGVTYTITTYDEAIIDGAYYGTLENAVANAEDGDTIILINDVVLEASLSISKDITIDLNGMDINGAYESGSTTNHIYAIINNGTLTIIDNVGGGAINSRGIKNLGNLILESGTINAIDGNGGYAVWNQAGSTFTMNGGTVATTLEDDNLVDEGGYDATTVMVDAGAVFVMNDGVINNVCDFTFGVYSNGTTTINGGSVTSVHTTIYNEAGLITITGGTFTCNGKDNVTSHVLCANGGNIVVSGGTFDGKDNYNGFNVDVSSGSTVTITGGNFLFAHSGSLYGDGTIAVSGGIFFDPVPENFCAEGFVPYENEDGTYTTVLHTCEYDAVVTAPTCTEQGYTTYTCATCGDSYVADYVDALGHTEVIDAAVAPSCTETGLTEGKHCSVCGEVLVAQEVVEALGHDYTAVVTAPTCTEQGYTTYICTCGDSYVADYTDPVGHSYESIKVAPSETDTGYTIHTCSGCDDVYYTDSVPSLSGVVQNVTTTTDGDTVTITWDALTAVDKYIAYVYAMDGTLVKCAQKTTNAVSFAGLELGDYVVLVIAKTSKGWYEFLEADEVPFTISNPEEEQGPSASVGEIAANYVRITWPAVEGATKYTVMIVGGGETIYRAAAINEAYVYGLKPGTQYEVSVNAKIDGKYGGYGESCALITASNDNAVLSIDTLLPSSVTLTWDAVDNANKYFIKLDTEDGTKYYSTTSTSITISGLTAQKSYTVSINTRSKGENYSGYGSSITFTTPDYEGIAISSQLKADGVHLSWTSEYPFDKVWVKEALADGTEIQHAVLTNESKFTVDGYVEGTREFFLILRVRNGSSAKYVTTDAITVTAPALKEVKVASEAELKSALAAAQVGEIVKITLTADINATLADDAAVLFSVPKATDVVLNLNGHTINATLPDNDTAQNESVFIVNQDATLAVEGNGTINTTVGTNGAGSYIFNNSGATLLLVDGNYNLTLEEGKSALIAAIIDSNSTLGETKTTILDGNYETSDNIGNMFRNFANHSTETCSLIIEGGNFTSRYSSASYPKAVIWNQAPSASTKGTGYVNIVRGTFSGLEVENEHPAENVTIGKRVFIGVYGSTTYVEDAVELKAALAAGGYIVLNGDIDLTAADGAEITGNTITENTVLDLNGNTISYAANYVAGMSGTQISAITVDNGATLVIGNGSIDADSAYGIYVKNGNLVIESGSYNAITSAVQVYVGKAEIKGGTFAGDETYLLNCIDAAYNNGEAQIVVTGGEFVGFDPANNAAEGEGTNFVAEGYGTIENDGVYTIGVIVNSGSDIQDAIDSGEGSIILGGDIDLGDLGGLIIS